MEENNNKYTTEVRSFYKNFIASHPALIERVNSQKFVFYVYVILTLVVVSFFGIFVIRPTVLTIFQLREEYSENEDTGQKLDAKLAALDSLETQRQQLAPQLAILDSVIPTDAQIPQLVRKLEVLAKENNATLSRIEVGAIEVYPNEKADSPFFTFNFNMNVKGDANDLNSFLSDLIFFDRLVSLDRVSGGSVEGGQTEYIIVGRTYFYNGGGVKNE